MLRALLCALAAAVTLFVINLCQIVLYGNGTGFALLGTNHTADTTGLAGYADILALVLGVAGNCLWCFVRNDFDEGLWTCTDTLATGYTLFLIYHSHHSCYPAGTL